MSLAKRSNDFERLNPDSRYFASVGGFLIWLGIVTRRDRKAEAEGKRARTDD